MTQISDLTERVVILQQLPVSDGQGGHTITWVDLVTASATLLTRLLAKVRPLTVRESLAAAALQSTTGYIVTLNYRTDVTALMRVQWTPFRATAAKTLEIHGAAPEEGGRVFLELQCSET